MQNRIDWLFMQAPGSTNLPDFGPPDYGAPNLHGPCMLSKVTGPYGASSSTKVTVVKVLQGSYYMPGRADMATQIMDDIHSKGLEGRAIIVESGSRTIANPATDATPQHPSTPEWVNQYNEYQMVLGGTILPGTSWDHLHQIYSMMVSIGAVLFMAAGNDEAGSPYINSIPQMWCDTIPCLNVGATDKTGNRARWSFALPNPSYPNAGVTLWAPGDEIQCIGYYGATGTQYIIQDGTSFGK